MHKGHHQRGYLPHRDYRDSMQLITFREADSLPTHVIEAWKEELAELLASADRSVSIKAQRTLRKRIDRYEDAGHGRCHLQNPAVATLVEDAFRADHPDRYRLLEWCVMPNHVHLLVTLTTAEPLGKLVQRWKGATAIAINRHLGRQGTFWGPDYHDRAIRDEDHYWNVVRYIRHNPVKAGLIEAPEHWPHSSAAHRWDPDA